MANESQGGASAILRQDIRRKFLNALQAGQQPQIEGYLNAFPPAQHPAVLGELLAHELAWRYQQSGDFNEAQYIARFPEHKTLICKIFSEFVTKRHSAKIEGEGHAQGSTQVLLPSQSASTTFSVPKAASTTESRSSVATSGELILPCRFGDYELLEELGKGGMGVVFKARQLTANRLVALKLIRPDQLSKYLPEERRHVLARFRNEVRAAAQLEHDHVVTVYEVGEIDGQLYYAMRLVDGESLKDRLSQGPLEPESAARYIEQVARALAEAHARGILHRDLKPHNVMLDHKTDRALLADFGLAKLVEGDQQLTASEAVMGSPPYMSPEQTLDSGKVTAASDVYALGATLYHLLTGRPPFQAANAINTMMQVQSKEVVSPRLLNPGVPLDLETICLKCLEKNPARRFASALDVADRLARVQCGQPIPERPISRVEKARRWCRKNPIVATLSAAIIISLIAGTAISTFFGFRASHRATEADIQRKLAVSKTADERRARAAADKARASAVRAADAERITRRKLEKSLKASRLRLAQSLFEQGVREADDGRWRPGLANLHRAYALTEPSDPLQAHRLQVLVDRALAGGRLSALPIRCNDVIAIMPFSSDGERIVGVWRDKMYIWDALTGRPIGQSMPHNGSVATYVVSHNRDVIASQTVGKEVHLWDGKTGKCLKMPLIHEESCRLLGFSRDDSQLATRMNGNRLCLWDMRSGELAHKTERIPLISGMILSPDFSRFAAHIDGQTSQIWDVRSSARLGEPIVHFSRVGGFPQIAFSPTGNHLYSVRRTGHDKGELRVYDSQNAAVIGEPLTLDAGSFNLHGDTLAVRNGTVISLFDLVKRQKVGESLEHPQEVKIVIFSADGQQVTTKSGDGRFRIWDVASGQMLQTPEVRDLASCRYLALSPRNDRLATFGADGPAIVSAAAQPSNAITVEQECTLRVWKTECGRSLFQQLPREFVRSAALSPDAKRIATGGFDGITRIWDLASSSQLGENMRHTNEVRAIAFSPSGEQIATASVDKTARIWDASTGKPLCEPISLDHYASALSFSPEGQRVIISGLSEKGKGSARIWNVETGQSIGQAMTHEADVRSVAFSPDGKRVATGSDDRTARIWDAWTARPLTEPLSHDGPVMSLVFSSNGQRLATGSFDFAVRVWNVKTGKLEIPPFRRASVVSAVDFSPDGSLLAVAAADGVACLVDAKSGHSVGAPMQHPSAVHDITFSPDGMRVATAQQGQAGSVVRLWDALTGISLGAEIKTEHGATSVVFSSKGDQLMTDRAEIWDVRTPPLPQSPDMLRRFLEVATFHRVDSDGVATELNIDEWFACWAILAKDETWIEQFRSHNHRLERPSEKGSGTEDVVNPLYPLKQQQQWAADNHRPSKTTNSMGMTFRLIPPGMYARSDKEGSEGPRQFFERAFYAATTEVTERQFDDVMMGDRDVKESTAQLPVVDVSWLEAAGFCNRLSKNEARSPYYRIVESDVEVLGGDGYRLLTSEEWEYAASEGYEPRWFHRGEDWNKFAWYAENSGGVRQTVAKLECNGFGLHDCYGNVWEWCYPPGRFHGLRFSSPRNDLRPWYSFTNAPTYKAGDVGFRIAYDVQPR